MGLKVAINGFGRIGRVFLRNALLNPAIEVVAINDITDNATLAHLFKYDSIHRSFQGSAVATADGLLIDGQLIKTFAEKDPSALPWGSLGVDIVIESTGKFLSREKANLHLQAGAKQVILSAPPEGKDIPTNILYDQDYNDLVLRVKILEDYRPHKREKGWSFLSVKKATLLNYKKLLIIAYGIHTSTEKPSSSSLHGGTKLSKKPTKKSKAGGRNTSNGTRRTTVS